MTSTESAQDAAAAPGPSRGGNRAITLAWIALCAITIGSWWLSPAHSSLGAIASVPITVAVVILGFVKCRLIIRYFMEVGAAPPLASFGHRRLAGRAVGIGARHLPLLRSGDRAAVVTATTCVSASGAYRLSASERQPGCRSEVDKPGSRLGRQRMGQMGLRQVAARTVAWGVAAIAAAHARHCWPEPVIGGPAGRRHPPRR